MLISTLVFAIGHLPIASMLVQKLTIPLTSYVIAANSVFGLIAGFLYWKKGLESAMLAHMLTHVVLISASYLGVYF
jgi:membrane protease YdiL (CAAX protease family)